MKQFSTTRAVTNLRHHNDQNPLAADYYILATIPRPVRSLAATEPVRSIVARAPAMKMAQDANVINGAPTPSVGSKPYE